MQLEDRMLLAGFSSPVGHGFTPAQIQTAYGINAIRLDGVIGNGAGQTIAIVDQYNDPTIAQRPAGLRRGVRPARPAFVYRGQL